jgi:hypothetical protein
MTAHQLGYVHYLLRQIKDLYVETQAMSVLLDTAKSSSGSSIHDPWRNSVRRMKSDPVFCSSVEANFGPYFLRLEQALQDERLFKNLQASEFTICGREDPRRER